MGMFRAWIRSRGKGWSKRMGLMVTEVNVNLKHGGINSEEFPEGGRKSVLILASFMALSVHELRWGGLEALARNHSTLCRLLSCCG